MKNEVIVCYHLSHWWKPNLRLLHNSYSSHGMLKGCISIKIRAFTNSRTKSKTMNFHRCINTIFSAISHMACIVTLTWLGWHPSLPYAEQGSTPPFLFANCWPPIPDPWYQSRKDKSNKPQNKNLETPLWDKALRAGGLKKPRSFPTGCKPPCLKAVQVSKGLVLHTLKS